LSRYALTEEFERLLGQPIVERSQNAMVRCPFHQDDRPSMSIDLDRGVWVCFGCGEKGSIFSLAHRLEQELDETDILLRATQAAAAQPFYEEPPDFREKAEEMHQHAWRTQSSEVVRYLVHKQLSGKVFRHFKLGWNGKAISMPYYDDERVVGIKYRAPDGFKYAETGTVRYIYNVNDIRATPVVILCEGESDTHSVWSSLDRSQSLWQNVGVAGVPGVGKGQPSKATWELWSLELMWAKRVFIAFDADEAGDNGAMTPMSLLGSKAVRIRPTKGKDMSDHLLRGGTLNEAGLDDEDVHVLLAG
jgi:DNA primase